VSLMRVLAKVDEKGNVTFPGNISREAGLKPGQLVELKIVGPKQRHGVLVSAKGK
jgi:bifunctional DNA-binding transcriptional regulator/antitoxin component of YhaV-PrlF toxin-antitoxin module